MKYLPIVLLLFVVGCVTQYTPPEPHASAIIWSKGIAQTEWQWRGEVEKRFGNAVMLVCHGSDVNGQWMLDPDSPRPLMRVQDVAETLHAVYPNRNIVIMSCNPGHRRISVSKVYYALDYVWTVPDVHFGQFADFAHHGESGVGKIEDFVGHE